MLDYIWQVRYQAALAETEPVLIKAHIKKSREVIVNRLRVLDIGKYPAAMQEYEAIQNAERQLKILERELTTHGQQTLGPF